MKIAFLQDFDIFKPAGGAEISDRHAFVYALKKGHDMQLVNPESARGFSSDSFDLLIVSNTSRFPVDWLLQTVSTKPYIMYLHDYLFLCKYRLFYPMDEKCKKCKNIDTAKKLLLNSALNIFLSPLHFRAWCFAIPELKDHPHHVHPSPIDFELFSPREDIKRNPNAGLCINVVEFKGSDNVIEYCKNHPDITWTFIGGIAKNVKLPPNCAHIGPVPHSKVPSMFAQASYYVELPSTPQPFERQTIEARLMGVPHIVVNKLVGSASYAWFNGDIETIKKHIGNAVPNFWKKIEGVMK